MPCAANASVLSASADCRALEPVLPCPMCKISRAKSCPLSGGQVRATAPCAARQKAAILVASLTPGADSTPDDTSTYRAPVTRIASATLSGVKPPASIHGTGQRRPAIKRQSNDNPLPPGSSAVRGGLASTRIWSATVR